MRGISAGLSYVRAGSLVTNYRAEESAFIVERYRAGDSTYAIARAVNKRFRSCRNADTVYQHLVDIGAHIATQVQRRLTDDERERILTLRAIGFTQMAIAARVGRSQSVVGRVVRG